ncbi:MAG: S4 domain-containing protein [Candidatus Altiarchaeota archaeon]
MHLKSMVTGIKGVKWTSRPKSSHKDSITLLDVLRGQLGYADNSREARNILNRGLILVNKRVVRDPRYGVGLMDVIEIPLAKKHYRVLVSSKGLYLKEIDAKESNVKLCRVNGKRIVSGGKTQLNLHDGSNILTDKDVKVNDSVLIELPSLKLKESLGYAAGMKAMVYRGRHGGELGVIEGIIEGTASRKSLTKIGDLQTLTEYVMIVGKKEPLITI